MGDKLTDEERAALVAQICKEGSNLEKVAAESGASELALAKAAAGIPCQKGTIALARNYVAKVSA
jgi:hypothetical protein